MLAPASYVFSSTTATPIPALRTVISTISVNQDITIGSLQVTLNITHPYDSDLFIFLEAPNGTEVLLVSHRGGSGRNFVNTVLSSSASKAIRAGSAPFTGTFLPESPLSVLAGADARGVWTLWVENNAAGVVGVLNSWSLTITPRSTGSGSVSGDLVRALTQATPAEPTLAPVAARAEHAAVVDAVFAASAQRPGRPLGWIPGSF